MSTPAMTSISEEDYCAIENALQSTQKGRRFLRAYTDRNRSLESRRLLRSISRLHRAALGEPGLHAEIARDLVSLLRSVASHRQAAARSTGPAARADALAGSLDEIEASLIALIEAIEERAFEALNGGYPGTSAGMAEESRAPQARLLIELSSYFSGEPG